MIYKVHGIEDSLLFFENIPQSKTYIDSIFVVNDQWGSSSIVLQNGSQKNCFNSRWSIKA